MVMQVVCGIVGLYLIVAFAALMVQVRLHARHLYDWDESDRGGEGAEAMVEHDPVRPTGQAGDRRDPAVGRDLDSTHCLDNRCTAVAGPRGKKQCSRWT
jgi:hypothetical protein